jgi:hypothetical protein
MKRSFSTAALLVALAVGPTPARAVMTDANGTIAGSLCQKVGLPGTLRVTADDGAVYNHSSSAVLTIDCPIASAGQGSKTLSGFSNLWYLDQSTSSISCTLRAEDAGTTAVNQLSRSSTGDDNGYRSLDFGNVQGFAGGQMHLRCTIPPRDAAGNASFVISYIIRDDGPDATGHKLGYHTFPGTNCRRIGSDGSVGFTTDGTIFNDLSGGNRMHVDCPMFTTRNGGSTGPGTVVWYLDDSPEQLSCMLRAEDAGSVLINSVSFNSSVNDNIYRSASLSGLATFNGGFVHMHCWLPVRDSGGLASYVVGYAIEPL